MPNVRVHIIIALLYGLWPAGAGAETGHDPAAAFDEAIAAAESSLRDGEVQAAESRYRDALLHGWMLVGTLDRLDGRIPEARDAFRRASTSAVENRVALQALSLAHLQLGEPVEAVRLLNGLAENGEDLQTRRLLAQALMASGQTARGVEALEAAHAAAPADAELTFALARGYLDLQKVDLAVRLFAQIAEARPIPQTHVLIGRAYSDFDLHERARAELQAALKQDPHVRRAHYYLGRVEVKEKGRDGLELALAEFQAELKLAPDDPLANQEAGIALVDLRRPEEALPSLEIAARAEPGQARLLYYLGRAQLAQDRAADAVVSLKAALAAADGPHARRDTLRTIHLRLAEALRKTGQTDEAAAHFAEAERTSAQGADEAREGLARYLADSPEPEPEPAKAPALSMTEASPLATLTPAARLALRQHLKAALARAYLNLGLMKVQAERPALAAEMFETAAGVDPDFPQVQSSLGVAYFNAGQFEKATGPLSRAVAATPNDAALKRLLAMAWLNTKTFDKAAALLENDRERLTNPSLQFAYGLALVKSGRAAEAERIFARLLAQNGDSAELSVLIGQAHAQQGDFESAIAAFERALRLKADVAEANAGLGVIYWKQGRLPEAETALRAELKAHPADVQSQQNLAVVLDSQQRPEEAIAFARSALRAKPDFADARYLLGKILLAQGAADEAVEHLEAAARLAPEDANVHYQLGRAYQKLGRTELAQKELEAYRQIKDKRR